MKHLLAIALLSTSLSAFSLDRTLTVTFQSEKKLSKTDAQLLCDSLYHSLSIEAIQNLSISEDSPYSCTSSSNNKTITAIFHVDQES